MTRTLTTLTAAGALVAATLVTTPARAMDPWTAAAWFVGGLFVAGLFWAPYARAARPYGYAGAYGYAPGYRLRILSRILTRILLPDTRMDPQ